MWSLARKILIHDRVKFIVAAGGVSFSVMLTLVQVGFYIAFMRNASVVIDHSSADVWIVGKGCNTFDFAPAMSERVLYRVAGTPGIGRVERIVFGWGLMRLHGGGLQSTEVVGLERDARLLRPWNIVGGNPSRLREAHAFIVDGSEFKKLQVTGVGDRREINGHRGELVAVTESIRSFTSSPFLFTTTDSARDFTPPAAGDLHFVLAETLPGADLEQLLRRLNRIPGADAYTTPAFSAKVRTFWSELTGVGMGFFVNAVIGVLVGLVIVAQILYSGTLEYLKEYGTLKALGATNGAVIRVIVYQALFLAVLGYVIGIIQTVVANHVVRQKGLSIEITPALLLVTALATPLLCVGASTLAVAKVLRLDPATVFKE